MALDAQQMENEETNPVGAKHFQLEPVLVKTGIKV
jgi:hypothetical protein